MDSQSDSVIKSGSGGLGLLSSLARGWRLAAGVLALVAMAAGLVVWGGAGDAAVGVGFRYVNSGWVSPLDWADVGAFSGELRGFVLGSERDLAAFEGGFVSKVSRGNAVSLGRIEFDGSVLLAAYYVWRPVRGDPLSVVDLRVEDDGGRAVVVMELDVAPQGREYPYLYAPMVMVAVERAAFPAGAAVEFVFELDGAAADVVTAVPNPGGE